MAEPWTDDENSVLVQAYMGLVERLMAGQAVVKTHVYRSVSDQVGRGPKSVEFKMLNVSGVLVSLGYGFPTGLVPAHNFQQSLTEVVERELARRPHIAAYLQSSAVIQIPLAQRAVPSRGTDPLEEREHQEAMPQEYSDALAQERVAALSVQSPSSGAESFAVESLWDFATGGADVAAVPGKPPGSLSAPRPAAVDEAVEWMQQALSSGSARRRMLFLVGGPGGGKSHVAAALTAGLRSNSEREDGLAHRSYAFTAPGGSLRVINDATIPPEHLADPPSIAAELDGCDEDFVIACVNRGVLVDEAAREPDGTVGHQIAAWLRRTSNGDPHAAPSRAPSVESVGVEQTFFRQAVADPGSDREEIDLLAVFVDVCSLVEERPTTTLEDDQLSASPYDVAVFRPGLDRSSTPAGRLFSGLSDTLQWQSRGDWDPIAANLESFSSPAVRNGILSVVRAAEIASSQLLSFRELWGVQARIVAGALPETLRRDGLQTWLDTFESEWESAAKPDFGMLRELAALRFHEALFAEDRVGRHPVLRVMATVDPARDMVPGSVGSEDLGWATPVTDAFAGAELGASPLERLRASAATVAIQDAITPFDELLDSAYSDWMHQETDATLRADATAWYGRYLTRMVAVAHGYPAFASEIRTWTNARSLAPNLPEDLRSALTTLVSPRRDQAVFKSKSLIPMFASRTEPLRGRSLAPTLSVVVEDITFRTSVDGETVLLHLTEGDQPLGEVVLDLNLVREATASCMGWNGMTDATESTAPRLERFRSLRLIPRNRGTEDLRIAGSTRDHVLNIKEQM